MTPDRKARRLARNVEYKRGWRKTPRGWILVRLSQAKARSLAKGLAFDLRPEDVALPTHCPVFGVELRYSDRGAGANRASLDRIDPTRGYVRGNVWVISYRANSIKSDATLAELRQIATMLRLRTMREAA